MLTLAEALRRWQPAGPGAATDPVVLLAAVWAEIVGTANAEKSRPSAIAGDTLVVTTSASVWSQSLSLLEEQIVRKIGARLPHAAIARLRFRVGRVAPVAATRGGRRRRALAPAGGSVRAPSASAPEALARWRGAVEGRRRAKAEAGWKPCPQCDALIAPGGSCAECARALEHARVEATTRLLFEAPWLGYAGTARLVEGLGSAEYAAIRRQLLARWWSELKSAARAKRVSRGGRERSIAASYVVLESGLDPERITPATVRNALGVELYELLYPTERS